MIPGHQTFVAFVGVPLIDPWRILYPPPRLVHVEPYFRDLVLGRLAFLNVSQGVE